VVSIGNERRSNFISATNFNLLASTAGEPLCYISYIDCFARPPSDVFVPKRIAACGVRVDRRLSDTYLLATQDVVDLIERRRRQSR